MLSAVVLPGTIVRDPSASYTIELRPMNRMIFANLVHRPFRTIISVVAVAVEVTLILLIVGIMLGMLNDSKTRQAGIGADIMVQPPGSSLLMGISGAPVSVKVADKTAQAAACGGRYSRRHSDHDRRQCRSPRRHRPAVVRRGERRFSLPFGRARSRSRTT